MSEASEEFKNPGENVPSPEGHAIYLPVTAANKHHLNNNKEMSLGTCPLYLGKFKNILLLTECSMNQMLTTSDNIIMESGTAQLGSRLTH
jgi:hypothetical protein